MRGMGGVFKRKNSNFWWIRYSHRGKEFRESSGSPDRRQAEKFLKQRLKEIGSDQLGHKRFIGPQEERVTVEELLQDLVADHRLRGRKSLPITLEHLKAIRSVFGMDRAIDVTPSQIRQVATMWQSEGVADATITRRLGILKRAFALARRDEKITSVPSFPTLPGDKPREGFFERGEFLKVLSHLPNDGLRDFTEWAYWTGMRKGEISSLRWATFDQETWTLRLSGRDTKTGKERKLVLEGPLHPIIKRRVKARRLDCSFIFHRAGEPIGEFRKSWRSACNAAGVSGRIFHDLRRTAVRNLIRAGVPQSVAMKISGHQTAAVFRRYDITADDDLRDAVLKVQGYVASLPRKAKVTPFNRASKSRVR